MSGDWLAEFPVRALFSPRCWPPSPGAGFASSCCLPPGARRAAPARGRARRRAAAFWVTRSVPFRVDKLSLLFGYLFHIAAFIGIVFALHLRETVPARSRPVLRRQRAGRRVRRRPHQLFVFWELLALTSVFLIWARRSERAVRAGFRYLVIHVLSGVLLLSGALMHAQRGRLLAVRAHRAGRTARGVADPPRLRHQGGFPLLHNWLTDAYPEGTPHRHRLPERLHHQGGGLRAGAGLRRHRAADLHRRRHDLLPDLLRRHRERPAPRAGLQHDQPDRLHGRGIGIGTALAVERRRGARLQRRASSRACSS